MGETYDQTRHRGTKGAVETTQEKEGTLDLSPPAREWSMAYQGYDPSLSNQAALYLEERERTRDAARLGNESQGKHSNSHTLDTLAMGFVSEPLETAEASPSLPDVKANPNLKLSKDTVVNFATRSNKANVKRVWSDMVKQLSLKTTLLNEPPTLSAGGSLRAIQHGQVGNALAVTSAREMDRVWIPQLIEASGVDINTGLMGGSNEDRAAIARLVHANKTRMPAEMRRVTIEVAPGAFKDVETLYNTLLHEYAHLRQFQRDFFFAYKVSGENFVDCTSAIELEAYLYSLETFVADHVGDNPKLHADTLASVSEHLSGVENGLGATTKEHLVFLSRSKVKSLRGNVSSFKALEKALIPLTTKVLESFLESCVMAYKSKTMSEEEIAALIKAVTKNLPTDTKRLSPEGSQVITRFDSRRKTPAIPGGVNVKPPF